MSEQTKPGRVQGTREYTAGYAAGYAAAAGPPREAVAWLIVPRERRGVAPMATCKAREAATWRGMPDMEVTPLYAAPPAASADQSTEVASAAREDAGLSPLPTGEASTASTSVDPAASAAPKADTRRECSCIGMCGKKAGDRLGDGYRCALERAAPTFSSPAEVWRDHDEADHVPESMHRVVESRIHPPTPDDGRSDAEWSDSVCDQLIADAVPGWNREFLVNDFRRVVRRVAQFSAKHGKRIAETPAKTGSGNG